MAIRGELLRNYTRNELSFGRSFKEVTWLRSWPHVRWPLLQNQRSASEFARICVGASRFLCSNPRKVDIHARGFKWYVHVYVYLHRGSCRGNLYYVHGRTYDQYIKIPPRDAILVRSYTYIYICISRRQIRSCVDCIATENLVLPCLFHSVVFFYLCMLLLSQMMGYMFP